MYFESNKMFIGVLMYSQVWCAEKPVLPNAVTFKPFCENINIQVGPFSNINETIFCQLSAHFAGQVHLRASG